MRIIAKRILWEFWEQHRDAEKPLKTWYKETSKATWEDSKSLKAKYNHARILKGSRVIFNISRNRYRLVVEINYLRKWVFVRFIGTHSDYDRIDAETI